MASNDYHFISRWRVGGTVEEVCAILADAPDLARWWPSVYLDVQELAPGDERGIDKVVSLHTRGWLPYTLRWQFRVTESDYPRGFALEATGDFVGRGVWSFAQDGPFVDITYDWRISAEKPLLRHLSFIMKPIFSANHQWAMRKGEESLARELRRRRGAALRPGFDPEAVGRYEGEGWAAYYDRDWPRVLWLMVRLNREQFGMGWPTAAAAAYDTVRAAAAFAPLDNDLAATRRHLGRFFTKARRSAQLGADAATLAELELGYWVVHRELARRRKANRADDDITPMVDSLAALHAALFDSTPERMRVSAALRALAAATVDRITGGYSDDVAGDWRKIHGLLRQAYQAALAVDRRGEAAS